MTSAGANTWSVPLEINNLESQISQVGAGAVQSVSVGNTNLTLSGTAQNPILSGTLTDLTSSVAGNNNYIAGMSAPPFGTSAIVCAGTDTFLIEDTLFTPLLAVANTGVLLGGAGTLATVPVTAPTVTPTTDSTDKVATTAFVQSVIGSTANVSSITAGTNITLSGTANAPIVGFSSPLTSTLDVGSQDITSSTGNVELIAGVVSVALIPPPASPAGVFIATGTGGRVEISQGDLFMNGSDIQDVSTLQAFVLTNNTNISPDLTINAPFGNVLIEGITISGTTITAPATNADIAFAMNGTGGLTVSNTSAMGGADPMLTLTNTSTIGGTTANPVKILTYKNDSNTTASDLIGEYTVRANGGGATSSTPYDYTSVRSFARGVGLNNVDGSLALQVAENGTPSSANLLTYVECNGGNARVEIKKNIDLTNQDLLNVKQIALGSLTAVGTAGQVITSRGTGGGTTTYSSPNQTAPVGTSVGGNSIDTTTPNFNFAVGAGIAPSFVPVPNNRYRVDFSVSLEGPNQGILVIPRVGYNSVDYFGDIYQDPALGSGANPYVSEPTTASGLHYHSINFTDYFTIPITASNTISFSVGILSTSGTATVSGGAKVGATISPCFD
jgi:hypothetical protein